MTTSMTDIWVTTWPSANTGGVVPRELLHDTEREARATEARLLGQGLKPVVYVRAAGVAE